MAPPASHFIDSAKGGGIKRLLLALSLRCRQTYFFPIPRPFAISFPGANRANHRSIRLSDDVFGSNRRQEAKGLFILFLKPLGRSLRMRQSRFPHGAGTDLKTVMFQHPRRSMPK